MHWLAVALGGSVGALARYALAILLPHVPGKLPIATLLVNVVGSFLMGVFFVVIVEKGLMAPHWRQFIMIGLLGAFTTFSTFSIESFQLVYTGYWRQALLYVALSVVLSILAAISGFYLLTKIFE